ncbi:MAG: hypothetical protein Q8881_03285 [Sweet potato little leaf phytoplasma]|nr:hypothetical protein [Sweet potato little leaf phytoplasma]
MDVSDEIAESIPPNFPLGDVSDETIVFPPNFALVDVSPETAEFPPNYAFRAVYDATAKSIPPNFALGTILTKRPNFRRISLMLLEILNWLKN